MTAALIGWTYADEVLPDGRTHAFVMPEGTTEGDRFVVIGHARAASFGAPSWLYVTYEDTSTVHGTQIGRQYPYSIYGSRSLLANEGFYESGHGRLLVNFAPADYAVTTPMGMVLLAYSGMDGMSGIWASGVPGWIGVSTITTRCFDPAERLAWWTHVLMPDVDESWLVIEGGERIIPDGGPDGWSVVGNGPDVTGPPVTWTLPSEFDPFGEHMNAKWIVFGMLPTLDPLNPTANDVAGAIGSGRFPVR